MEFQIESQREIYRAEACELLSELETSLLALEEDPCDTEVIGRVFRALHTIKGSGAMAGFDDIASFTHDIENVFDLLRNNELCVTKTLVDLTLQAGDRIRSMLDVAEGEAAALAASATDITNALKQLIPTREEPAAKPPQTQRPEPEQQQEQKTFRIYFRPNPEIFSRGANPLLLFDELRQMGKCTVIAHTEAVPDLEELDPEECHFSWDVILTTNRGENGIRDVFIFVEDDCELEIKALDMPGLDENGIPPKRLGEILIERGLVSYEDLQKALGSQTRLGELLVARGVIEASMIESSLAEQEHLQAVRSKHLKEEQASSIRVRAEKLDTLVNLVGEMVTVQARLSQTAASIDHPELMSIAEEVEHLTAELRDNTLSIRMLPIGTTFTKFNRLVRDLSGELGKEILLTTDGGETELDKTVIERLNDPLVHLIRNCIDHGIEAPQTREAAGKPRQGTVRLSAMHSGASVLIRITDDGAGLASEAIRSKAIERGLISADAELSEKEIFSLIFAPGFSTAAKITSVSGRGVGMDVVKRSLDALRGSIDVSSRQGVGTTITLKLPLTLAIVDGLLVQVRDGRFVLPLSTVEECVELTREDVARAHGRHITRVRGEIVPYIRLRERFAINGERPEVEQIVITESAGGKVGLVVDKVIGEHQTVIKNIGKVFQNVDELSGATILGDGTVALIIDVHKLVQSVEMDQASIH
ncbi:MAG: chemotaxis protein CheA [Syntrophobacteraceae bacterium]|nr:chemotaxis protein CheA [Syntrophobacteraceae bacterium]